MDVQPGKVVFLGHYLLKALAMDKADPAQTHYYHLIQPAAAAATDWARVARDIYPALGSLHLLEDDADHEADFWQRAKGQEFAGKGAWLKLIDQHLEVARGP